MTAGDPAQWDDFFAADLIPSVISLVLETWARIEPPSADEHEDRTTVKLYTAMVRAKDRSRHSFLIRYQDVEVDFDLSKESGRKDIVFFPPLNDEETYFCLEAKRLNVTAVGSARRSLADEYVKEGMQRFIDRKYSRRVGHGGMLGYVLDGDVPRAMENVAKNIRANHVGLRMAAPGTWVESIVRPGDAHAKETLHTRVNPTAPFRLHHLFVQGGGDNTVAAAVTFNPAEDRR